MVERPNWEGRTVVCIASGPSLTPEDVEMVRSSGHPVIVTNTTHRLCPWADVLFGFDWKWWKAHRSEVKEFAGRKFCASPLAKDGVESLFGVPWFTAYRNSGACSVSIAIACGAARGILLGFDAQPDPAGRRHWHPDHSKGLENASTMFDWPRTFSLLAKNARRKGVPVVNASRSTALAMFPRARLEDVL